MLRAYQHQALMDIRSAYRNGTKRILLHMPTGSGKTVIFCEVARGAIAKGNPTLIITRGRKIVDQASERLSREGLDHGVLMANHKKYDLDKPVQVASIDTVLSRGIKPKASLIIIDEAHLATSKGYADFIAQYPDAWILSVTATPFPQKPLKHLAERVVRPTRFSRLVELNYLSPPKYFCPSMPDLSKVKIKSTGDYDEKDLEKAMGQSITGDIVSHWKKHASGRPTIVFAISIEHSKAIVRTFIENGVTCAHCDSHTKDEERERLFTALKSGEISVLVNVGILSTGVDIPEVSCIVLARPTRSLCLYYQQLGRGTRIAEGKKDLLILDHADNVRAHGFLEDEPEANLEGVKLGRKSKPNQIPIKVCEECFAAVPSGVLKCPQCEFLFPKRAPLIKRVEGNLQEVKRTEADVARLKTWIEIQERERDHLLEIAAIYGNKIGWVYHQLLDKYGKTIAGRLMKGRWGN